MVVASTPHLDGLPFAHTKADKLKHPSVTPYGNAILLSQCHRQKQFTAWVPLGSIVKTLNIILAESIFEQEFVKTLNIKAKMF